MADPSRPTVRRRRLGRELRRIRDDSGLTLETAARRLDRTASSLSKIERGVQGLRHGELVFMLDTYAVTDDDLRQELIQLRRDANKKGWWLDHKGTLSPMSMDLISLESDASAIRTFQTVLVPGLLQTADYVRAIKQSVPFVGAPPDIDQSVAIRMTRQQILTRADPPQLWAIISEAVLRQQVGGPDVMWAQLRHLLEVSLWNNVTMQVLPYSAGAHAGVDGAFMALEIDAGNLNLVIIESLEQSLILEDADARRYEMIFSHLCAAALSEPDSRAFIERLLSET